MSSDPKLDVRLPATGQRFKSRVVSIPRADEGSTARVGRRPLHTLLVPIAIACFVATLFTDIVYWQTAAMPWADLSDWLLLAGLLVSLVAAPAGLIDLFRDPQARRLPAAWIHGIGNVTALILSIINCLIHSRDAYTSVVPAGLILSALVVVILGLTGWNGWILVHRYGVGVRGRVGMRREERQ